MQSRYTLLLQILPLLLTLAVRGEDSLQEAAPLLQEPVREDTKLPVI